ncbi:unnamed protein product [Echinostoma caproni]|uniref:FK506-binding protein 5-like n=1 Tax=Echinostoma caproni TaxID=27848 RepID=A0A183A002_9TREM|nr:unnamed protein product [Echinostoma caproni]
MANRAEDKRMEKLEGHYTKPNTGSSMGEVEKSQKMKPSESDSEKLVHSLREVEDDNKDSTASEEPFRDTETKITRADYKKTVKLTEKIEGVKKNKKDKLYHGLDEKSSGVEENTTVYPTVLDETAEVQSNDKPTVVDAQQISQNLETIDDKPLETDIQTERNSEPIGEIQDDGISRNLKTSSESIDPKVNITVDEEDETIELLKKRTTMNTDIGVKINEEVTETSAAGPDLKQELPESESAKDEVLKRVDESDPVETGGGEDAEPAPLSGANEQVISSISADDSISDSNRNISAEEKQKILDVLRSRLNDSVHTMDTDKDRENSVTVTTLKAVGEFSESGEREESENCQSKKGIRQ